MTNALYVGHFCIDPPARRSALRLAGAQADDKIGVVGLHLCLVRRLVAYNGSAPLTPVRYDISALWVGLRPYGAQNAAAGVCPVTGVYINVQGAKAEGTVVSGGVTKRKDLLATALTYKAVIIFGKSFRLHHCHPYVFLPPSNTMLQRERRRK